MSMIHQMTALTKEQLDLLLSRPEEVEAFIERQDEERFDECPLYKSWHCLHFLINDSAWGGKPPLRWAVFGDRELGTIDVGYGPARYLLPDQVRRLVEALRKLPPDDLLEFYDPVGMREAELYCAPREGKEEEWEEKDLREHYEKLVHFYERAAEAGHGVLTWLH
jgi:hypothetical protein